jgi:opacity protein-like surface antigen
LNNELRFHFYLMRLAVCAALLAATVGTSKPLLAQGAQQYGLQVAGLATSIGSGSNAIAGAGLEVQLRANTVHATEKYALSLGLGAQVTTHSQGSDSLTIAGAFFEPRFTPSFGSERVFPYLAGRLAYLQQSSNFGTSSTGLGIGGGGGVAIKLTKRLNLDAGVALVRQGFGDFRYNDIANGTVGSFKPFTTYAAKIGVSWGFPNR